MVYGVHQESLLMVFWENYRLRTPATKALTLAMALLSYWLFDVVVTNEKTQASCNNKQRVYKKETLKSNNIENGSIEL